MVSDLPSIARIESDREGIKLEIIDMKAVLQGLVESFSSLIEKKKASMRYDLNGVQHFVGDREKVKELLMNLVDNSLTFSDEGCGIVIRVGKKGDILEIVVSDTGWGIPEEDIPHLSERFYTRREDQGNGVGAFSLQRNYKDAWRHDEYFEQAR